MNRRRKVLVTGASSGIGRATALRFAAEGYDVCLSARRRALLNEVAENLDPGHHVVCPGDYSDPSFVDQMYQTLQTEWGIRDVLVNSAGVYKPVDAIETPLPQWREVFDLMVVGALLVTRMVVPLMTDGGRIIHVTSIHGQVAEISGTSYGMAKAAINQFCRGLALELAPRGILVNAIAPGFVETPMCVMPDGTNELETEWFLRNYVEGHFLPLRRPAQPEEIAGVARFLAGPDATYITGQTIVVDGGLTITF
jgi:NAD(P)-dependent dehydrogenase (short-subunit alcohol dehydrogenase family)